VPGEPADARPGVHCSPLPLGVWRFTTASRPHAHVSPPPDLISPRRLASVLGVLVAMGAALAPAAAGQAPPPPPPPGPPTPPSPPPGPTPPPAPPPVYSLVAPFAAGRGQGVLVRGNGFGAGSRVTVTMAGRPVGQTVANSIGNFATGFAVPSGVGPGTYPIVAEASGRSVRASVRIVPGRRPPLAVATSSTGATLATSSTSGRPGRGIHVVATGLPPGKPVVVQVGGQQVATGRVGPGGGFSRWFGIPRQSVGRHELRLATAGLLMKSYVDILPSRLRSWPGGGVRMVAVGDIACQPGQARTAASCQQQATAQLALELNPRVVAMLGDMQYSAGAIAAFAGSFDASWGPLKSRMRPTLGNHEYLTPGAAGYFAYYGSAAAPPNGWYSYDVGTWHVVVLNSNCIGIVDCSPTSPQVTWLRGDLGSHGRRCTLAYFHHPRFSSAGHFLTGRTNALWSALYDYGVDVVLNGHAHVYERFAPQDIWGHAAPGRGIRQFTVGSGGVNHDHFVGIRGNSEVRSSAFGVLALALRPGGYRWSFLTTPSGRIRDGGSAPCH
jgi:Calcineurin-like phosphoesterase